MKIATWNVERLKHYKDLDEICHICNMIKADILVLTETDSRISLDYEYCYQTPLLAKSQSEFYSPTENRVSIYTNYKCKRQYPTYDEQTAICVELETERGGLLIYGTIIGIFGNREKSFKPDLEQQTEDIKNLTKNGANICAIGDYNLSFSDNYYYTKYGRDLIKDTFDEYGIRIITADRQECIDHIAISEKYIGDSRIHIDEWNYDKSLSDHKGIVAEIML